MGFLDFFQTLGSNIWIYGGTFLLVLGILVFVHEWGHYIIAKLCGVHVDSFSVGFGKEIWGATDKAGTRWKLSIIPLGGYVKLYGDTDPASAGHSDEIEDEKGNKREMTPEEREQAFFTKPVWKRAAIVFAGPAINYIFAIILLAGLYMFNGQPVTQPSGAAIIAGSAAEKAGFQPHDLILSIDGKTINSFEDIRREMMIALDDEKHFVLMRSDRKMDIYAKPERLESEDRFGFKHSRGLLGLISPRHAIQIENITHIDGVAYERMIDKQRVLAERLESSFSITLSRGEEAEELFVHPLADSNKDLTTFVTSNVENKEAAILFLSDREANTFLRHNPIQAFGSATYQSYVISRGTFEALGQMIMGTRSARELGGIIRIGALAGDMAQQGVIALILFTALLSINLGLINLFPIPMLDGGHLVFYAVEAVLGKPVPEQVQEYAFRAGFVFLVAIMVFTNMNDIIQLIL